MHITPLLPQDTLDSIPIISLSGTRNALAPEYTGLQAWMLPYADAIHAAWWVCLAVTLCVVFTRFIALPLIRGTTLPPTSQEGVSGWYTRLFSLREVRDDMLVRWFGGAVLFGFFVTFRWWQMNPGTTVQAVAENTVTCWPFFQNCAEWIFLERFPEGYSQTTLFMGLFGLIVLGAYGLIAGRYVIAHASIVVLFIAKIYFSLINFSVTGNYDYYQSIFTFIFLFVPHKRFFASLTVAMLYVLSTVAKIHPSWTFGLYFTALSPGMPIFPREIVPVMTNFVIFMEMVMAWFLFSPRAWLQRSVFAFFVLFHLYSGTMVGYHYPAIVMPALLICFGPLFRPFAQVPLDRRSVLGWVLIVALWGLQSIQLFIPGDTKLTLEGNHYGLYMFDANHQCSVMFQSEDGRVLRERSVNRARFRCDPFSLLANAQNEYCGKIPQKIRMYMIHSINGGPFYAIVNEPDMCALTYKPFSRNPWIKDAQTAPIVGRPLQNLYD